MKHRASKFAKRDSVLDCDFCKSGDMRMNNQFFKSPYSVLGIPNNSTYDTVKIAFRELTKKYHPDKNPGICPDDYIEKFQNVVDAYNNITKQVTGIKLLDNSPEFPSYGTHQYLDKQGQYFDLKYTGWFLRDKWNGYGKVEYLNGDIYEGFFSDNKLEGQGVYYYHNGEKAVGNFSDGKLDGQREEYHYLNGDRIIGKFICGSAVDGKFIFAGGGTYTGAFKNQVFHGYGNFTLDNNYEYAGEFQDGYWEGHGKLTLSDGRIFEGEFRNGKLEGPGTLTLLSNSVVYESEFQNYKLIKANVTIKYPNADQFSGRFEDGNPSGVWIFSFASPICKEYECKFQSGRLKRIKCSWLSWRRRGKISFKAEEILRYGK